MPSRDLSPGKLFACYAVMCFVQSRSRFQKICWVASDRRVAQMRDFRCWLVEKFENRLLGPTKLIPIFAINYAAFTGQFFRGGKLAQVGQFHRAVNFVSDAGCRT